MKLVGRIGVDHHRFGFRIRRHQRVGLGFIFGLLHAGKFVFLSLGSPPDVPSAYADRLDVVTATMAGRHPDWSDVRAMLIRPDGYLAWATTADEEPPLGTWLGRP